jgi:Bacterial Ig-like domain
LRNHTAPAVVLSALLLTAPFGAAQRPGRIATTVAALTSSPLFFHGKQVVVHGQLVSTGDTARIEGTAKPIYVVWQQRGSRSGGEIRGEFWDVGRLQEGDSRFANVDFRPILEATTQGRWPNRDQVFVITGATLLDAEVSATPTIRTIALAPERFENKSVTLVGRFKGGNLYGDLPQAVGKSKWDFVLQSADAAVWVSGLRPRGQGFDLDPAARVDTGRWLEVVGTVRRDGAHVWIEGSAVKQTTAQQDAPAEVTVQLPPEPPPRVIFSAPVPDDTEVERALPVRLQFSRDMDGKSFRDRVRVSYVAPSQGQAPPVPAFAAVYNDGNRSLEIKFKQPLERFQRVKVELLEGITAVDRQPLPPWTLTFMTGG